MSSDSTNEGEVPHYAYLVLRTFPPFPMEIAILCHHAETNYIFLPGGRVGPSPYSKAKKVKKFLLETLLLQIGFRLPSDMFNKMSLLYWEQIITENYYAIKYSLYVTYVVFRDFIDTFRNIGGAHASAANISFKEELFNCNEYD